MVTPMEHDFSHWGHSAPLCTVFNSSQHHSHSFTVSMVYLYSRKWSLLSILISECSLAKSTKLSSQCEWMHTFYSLQSFIHLDSFMNNTSLPFWFAFDQVREMFVCICWIVQGMLHWEMNLYHSNSKSTLTKSSVANGSDASLEILAGSGLHSTEWFPSPRCSSFSSFTLD